MHVEHSSEQGSYSPMQLNDFDTQSFLLNNEGVSAPSPKGGDGREMLWGGESFQASPWITEHLTDLIYIFWKQARVMYSDTDRTPCISQDEGVAVYLPFLNNVIGCFTAECPSPPTQCEEKENK